jgi:regulatory protein
MPERVVELKSRPRDRVTVTLSGGRFFTIPAERAAAMTPGLELRDDEIDSLDRIDQYFRGAQKVNRLLSLRSRTKYELKTALDQLMVSEPVRDGLLVELVEQGLIDDKRFAMDYVRVKADLRSMGPHRLRADLKKYGVARAIIDETLGGEFDSERQETMARELVERKVAGAAIDERLVRRIAGLLRRKGYDYEIVNRISYELLQRAGSEAPE